MLQGYKELSPVAITFGTQRTSSIPLIFPSTTKSALNSQKHAKKNVWLAASSSGCITTALSAFLPTMPVMAPTRAHVCKQKLSYTVKPRYNKPHYIQSTSIKTVLRPDYFSSFKRKPFQMIKLWYACEALNKYVGI